jgi:hypothetical protein
MMDVANTTAVTAFVTVQENSMATAKVITAFVAAFNMSFDNGKQGADLPQPMAVNVTLSFCSGGGGTGGLAEAAVPTTARLRRLDSNPGHGNVRGFWMKDLKGVIYPASSILM